MTHKINLIRLNVPHNISGLNRAIGGSIGRKVELIIHLLIELFDRQFFCVTYDLRVDNSSEAR